jgi:prepilin-type processing-associated H-X9-DG protein
VLNAIPGAVSIARTLPLLTSSDHAQTTAVPIRARSDRLKARRGKVDALADCPTDEFVGVWIPTSSWVSGFLCPSDGKVGNTVVAPYSLYDIPEGKLRLSYTSYAACTGPWIHMTSDLTLLPRLTAQDLGLAYVNSAVRFAGITDGLSNTILFGEHAHSLLDDSSATDWHWWFDGAYGDTLFRTLYPMNPQRKLTAGSTSVDASNAYVEAASSFHPGGANFAFADGSVKFLKDTIDTWPFDQGTGLPIGVTGDPGTPYTLAPGRRFGVYQALSTRNGGEVISADAY